MKGERYDVTCSYCEKVFSLRLNVARKRLKENEGKIFCSRNCDYAHRKGMKRRRISVILPFGREKWDSKFRGKYIIDKKSGCFISKTKGDKNGYPVLTYNRKKMRANRLSWFTVHGEIPEGMCVCHKCDNPKCVNPDHLFLLSSQENTKDRDLKHRQAYGERHRLPCKLTVEDVRHMRKEHFQNGIPIRPLAKRYNVCFATVRGALNRSNWAWVE